ncbi:MAG: hypothetical protein H6839_01460 [Planctomycetes bacterium]|nr:hypothetical protein [Planctomycetota bacterium]
MLRTGAILVILTLSSFAAAQEYHLEVRSGVGDVVAPPYTRVQVQITRDKTEPFVGRIVVDVDAGGMPGRGRGGRRRGPAFESGNVSVTQDVSLEEGAASRVISLDVPVTGIFSVDVTLERRLTGEYYDEVATTQHSPGALYDPSKKLVGFVSPARLEAAQPFLFVQLVEIQVQDLPDTWKSLACFDAIVLNDDRLTRAQSNALVDYIATGGTVILSPSSPSSFNPETPAGQLLKIPATTQQISKELKDFSAYLIGELTPSGFSGPTTNPGLPVEEPAEETVAPTPATSELASPPDDSPMRLWPENGRSKPVPETGDLVSIARVGAGNLMLLHADISAEPFTTGDRVPTTAGVHLLELALKKLDPRLAPSPMELLVDKDVRDAIDIAGRRIPGRDALVVILLLYVGIAGVGMFLVARKFRKPELYPATLLAAALVSVALVFGIGELYKRSGDRVKTVRILVSDETTDRNALFELGCAYAVQGQSFDFVNSRKTALVPARFEPNAGSIRGMPMDPLDQTINFTAGEGTTHITDLDRWQNVFYSKRDPADLEGFRVDVESMPGAWRVTNRSPHELTGCFFLVGGQTSSGATCEWHYVSLLGAAGSQDGTLTFSESTRITGDIEDAARRFMDDTGGLTADVVGAMFNINPEDRLRMSSSFLQVESKLYAAGLRPDAGEFLLIAVLPETAISPSSIGAQGVDEGDIGQVNLWMVRGGVEGG